MGWSRWRTGVLGVVLLLGWVVVFDVLGTSGSPHETETSSAAAPQREVRGRVLTPAGEPVAGATVWVRPADDPYWRAHGYGIGSETTTQGNGEFVFPHVWRWKEWPALEVEARAPGWAPTLGRVPAKRGSSDMTLVLHRGAQITGRVVDGDGAPIPDAPVNLYVEESRLSQTALVSSKKPEPDFQVVAQADGTFRLAHLPEDRFDVLIDPPGFGGRILRGVEVPSGGEVELGMIELEPSGRIAGVVLDPRSQPLPESRVILLPGDAVSPSLSGHVPLEVSGGASTDADAEGRFLFEDVPPGGRFVLHASAPGRVPSMVFDVEATGAEPVELVLRPAARLFGLVEDPAGGAVQGVWVQLVDPEQGGPLRIPIERKRSDEHGRFAFEGLPSGTYGLVLGDIFLKDFELRAVVDLAEGEEHGPVVVTQSSRAALEVEVVSPAGEPVEAASVAVQVVDGPRLEAAAGEEGKVVFDDLPAEEVVVSASHGQLGTAEQSATLEPGHNEVGLILESGGQIRGRVVDPDGEPVSNASLDLEPVDAHLSALAFSEPDGSFVLDAPSPGTYRLRVEARGWASTEYPELLEVGTQALEGIEVRLRRGADLVGHVRGLEPDDLAHVRVSARSHSNLRSVHGTVSHDGEYRIEGLGAGSWEVTGELTEPRRVTHEQVVFEAGDEEVELDLVFSEGHTLTGVVRLRDEPAPQAILVLEGVGTAIEDRTDGAGSFRIAGLQSGEYRLAVSIFGTDLRTERTLSIRSDQAIEVRLSPTRVSGRLVSAGGEPVSGAAVHVLPLDDPHPLRHALSGSTTGEDGRFVLPPVLEGRYRLIARVPSTGSVAKRIEAAGVEMDLGDVSLESGRTLTMQPRFADGSPAQSIGVILVDEARNFLGADEATVDPDGVARISHVPEAARTAVVFPGTPAPYSAPSEIPLSTGSAEQGVVVFPAASRIVVRRPDPEPLRVGLTLRNAEGNLPPQLEFSSWGWFPMEGGEQTIGSLIPGVWTVELQTHDGETRTREVETRAGETTEVVFGD